MEHDFWKFASEHYLVFFWLALATLVAIEGMFKAVFFLLPNRVLRHLNIRKHGWPPVHCDADGDFKPEPKSEQQES